MYKGCPGCPSFVSFSAWSLIPAPLSSRNTVVARSGISGDVPPHPQIIILDSDARAKIHSSLSGPTGSLTVKSCFGSVDLQANRFSISNRRNPIDLARTMQRLTVASLVFSSAVEGFKQTAVSVPSPSRRSRQSTYRYFRHGEKIAPVACINSSLCLLPAYRPQPSRISLPQQSDPDPQESPPEFPGYQPFRL